MDEHYLIKKARADLRKAEERLCILRWLTEKYPDLHEVPDRWGNLRFYSDRVNAEATDYSIRRNCSCCHDASIEVRPYIDTEEGRVFGGCYTIGRGQYERRACEGWEELLRTAGVRDEIIERVRFYLRPEDDEDDEDLEDELE